MTIRYIGSKARLAEAILDIVGSPSGYSGRFVDGFCGTGVVARTAALRGWNVDCNDTLLSAAMITEASLLCGSELNFKELGSYESAIERLNACAPSDGYIWRTYSPASAAFCPHERRYLRNTMPAELMAPVISLPNGGIPASLGVLRRRSSLLMSLRLRTPLPILLVHMDAS